MSDPVLVVITVPNATAAHELAAAMVEQRLAAAVHIAPVATVYRWEGRVVRDDEHTATVRTFADRIDAINTLMHKLHPYQVPPILVHPVNIPSPQYEDWIRASTR
jgi:periplasmic divalent cation tolerance protein